MLVYLEELRQREERDVSGNNKNKADLKLKLKYRVKRRKLWSNYFSRKKYYHCGILDLYLMIDQANTQLYKSEWQKEFSDDRTSN